MNLRDEIDRVRARLEALERSAAAAPCSEVGHDWRLLGGANCGCHAEACCSVPVHSCARCGDCDYGDNPVATAMRAACRAAEIADG